MARRAPSRDRVSPAVAAIGGKPELPLANLIGEFSQADAPWLGWTEAQWDVHDAKVRASLEADQVAAAVDARRQRMQYLIDQGAPDAVAAVARMFVEGRMRFDVARHTLLDELRDPRVENPHWRGRPRRGLTVLRGQVGRGKSMLAVAYLIESGGSAPSYLHCNALASIERTSAAGQALERRWRHASALVLDDLGSENLEMLSAKGFTGLVEEIIDTCLMDQGRALLITTNAKADGPDGLAERYGKRFASRLKVARWRELAGPDLREHGAERIVNTERKR
jgi:hypothetical protein